MSSPAASGRTPLPIVVIDRFISQTAIVRMEEARLMVIPGSLRGAYLCGATY
jgi:hypothetical protein